MCFAESGPGGEHIDFATYTRMVDRYVDLEGIADVLQLSGGEPTLHPDLVRMVRYAYEQPIQVGDDQHQRHPPGPRPGGWSTSWRPMRDRLEIYLQFDGFDDRDLRHACAASSCSRRSSRRWTMLREHGIRCTLVCTVDHNDQPARGRRACCKFGLERPIVRGVSFQLATYCGRHLDPADLERRATMPDLVKGIVAQTGGLVAESDFYPLPCAHPNCHMMATSTAAASEPVPINRHDRRDEAHGPDRQQHRLHAGAGAAAGREVPRRRRRLRLRARRVRTADPDGLDEFVVKALAEKLTGADVFRVTLTAFLDAHTSTPAAS